jgi:hydrogenase/urease accessory protein HupE
MVDRWTVPMQTMEILGENAMKKIVMLALLLVYSFAFAHSGGTDKDGCHNDRKAGTRHCH